MKMSRSARNRAAHRARGTAPRGVVPTRTPDVPAMYRDRAPVAPSGVGIRRGSVSYGGAGDRGYSDAWNRTPYFKTAATVDVRWSK